MSDPARLSLLQADVCCQRSPPGAHPRSIGKIRVRARMTTDFNTVAPTVPSSAPWSNILCIHKIRNNKYCCRKIIFFRRPEKHIEIILRTVVKSNNDTFTRQGLSLLEAPGQVCSKGRTVKWCFLRYAMCQSKRSGLTVSGPLGVNIGNMMIHHDRNNILAGCPPRDTAGNGHHGGQN